MSGYDLSQPIVSKMSEPTRVSQLLLVSEATLAQVSNARATVACIHALPELDAGPARMVLVAREEHELERIKKLAG